MVFAREPAPGRVKKKLGREIGFRAAAALYRAVLGDIVGLLARHSFRFMIACTADSSREWFVDWLPGWIDVVYQEGENLGRRIENMFEYCFGRGEEHVMLLSSDVPMLSTGILLAASEWLLRERVVLGPSRDGGYYLLGLPGSLPGIFSGIDWRGPRILEETLERLRDREYWLLPELSGIRRRGDIGRLRGEIARSLESGVGYPVETAALLETMPES
ncbi:MAG TPA: TIGR04282 family arsenosugar biosynthesis glycosyltransferase [bacterium]|nr:TIGR04282 family arsenosugar biosynthesis glycosyltransferase [bacterium]